MNIDRLGLRISEHLSIGKKSCGRGEIDVRGAEVGMGLVGVEMVTWFCGVGVAVAHLNGLRPVQKILGSCFGDRTNTVDRGAIVKDVTALSFRPKSYVLRIEHPALGLEHGLFLDLFPSDTVGGLVGDDSTG